MSGAPEWDVASQSRLRSDFRENHQKYGFFAQLPHSLELVVPLELSLAHLREAYMKACAIKIIFGGKSMNFEQKM